MIEHIISAIHQSTRDSTSMTNSSKKRENVITIRPPPLHASPDRVILRNTRLAAIIPGDSVVEAVLTQGVASFLNLFNTACIIRLIFTWFPNIPPTVVAPVATVVDPYLNLFRGIIPPLGGTIDLSPILAFVTLDVFSSTAAALPAQRAERDLAAAMEMEASVARKARVSPGFLWRRRLEATRARRESTKA